MNINKYFLALPEDKQAKIFDIVNTELNRYNKQNSIYYVLFPEHIDFIYTIKRYDAICNLILEYADRINFYKKHGKSYGQYIRQLNKKLELSEN